LKQVIVIEYLLNKQQLYTRKGLGCPKLHYVFTFGNLNLDFDAKLDVVKYIHIKFVSKLLCLCLQILSRLGHMSYDVVGAQIIQTGIPSSKANLIGTTEVAVASLAESLMLGVAIIANDPSHFGCLAILSLLSVVGAACMFCRWLSNPTEEQKSLFSYHPQF
jgi:hypothetical protein